MLPSPSLLCTTTSTTSTTQSILTPPRPKLGFSIDSLVGGLHETPPKPKVSKLGRHQKHAKHFKSLGNGEIPVCDSSLVDSIREFDGSRDIQDYPSYQRDYRGEFRTNVCQSEAVRDMHSQMENIQQALYRINRNKRNNQHLSSPSSSSSSPSPPARKPSSSPKHNSQKGQSPQRRKTPPISPGGLPRTTHLHGQHIISPPASSPLPTHSPNLSSPISTSTCNSTLRIPEPIHPLNSSQLSLPLSNSLSNHLVNPLSNPLNFPPFGLPLAALLPQIRPNFSHPGLSPTSQELHNSFSSASDIISSTANSGLSGGFTPLTTACFTTAHLASNGLASNPLALNPLQPSPNGGPTSLSQSGPLTPHSGILHTSLPATWGNHGFGPGGLSPGSLGPALMSHHGLGTPLPPANLPRQYPVYPWLLTRHNRLFGHRFPGKLSIVTTNLDLFHMWQYLVKSPLFKQISLKSMSHLSGKKFL